MTADSSDSFPVIARRTWLNHAAISPWPRVVLDALASYVEDNTGRGELPYRRWMETERRLRHRLARLLGAEIDDIALVKNTSEGLSLIAAGLDWRPGDSVLFPAREFPSNRLPWLHLPPEFVRRREIDIDGPQPEQRLLEALDRNSRVLAVSSVRYDSGLRLNLPELATACRRNGTLLVVDAIQHLGAMALDVSRDGPDFVVAGSHKWLMAPEGIAIFWSRPEARARLKALQAGWRMWADPFNFDRTDWSLPDTARRYEPGTLNTAAVIGLDAAAGLLLETGVDEVQRRLEARCQRLIEGLRCMPGVAVLTPGEPSGRAGIVSLRSQSIPASRLQQALEQRNVIAATRAGSLRLSPHFYTPLGQIDTTLEHLDAILRNH